MDDCESSTAMDVSCTSRSPFARAAETPVAVVQEPLDPVTRMVLTQYAEVREVNSSKHVVVIRTTGGPQNVLMSDMDNSRMMKITAPVPRTEEEWEYLTRMAWPGIHTRLMQDPRFENRHKFRWSSVYEMCDQYRNKIARKTGFERKLVQPPVDSEVIRRGNIEKLSWPVGTNREFACILYSTRPVVENQEPADPAKITSTVYTLHLTADSIVTDRDERSNRPKWMPARLLDDQGHSQLIDDAGMSKKHKRRRHQMVRIRGIVKACMGGLDNTALFVTRENGEIRASLYSVQHIGMKPLYQLALPNKEPRAIACTASVIVLGYTGDANDEFKGLYVASESNQWEVIKIAHDPIASISMYKDSRQSITLMCGVDDDDAASFLALDIGFMATKPDLELIQQIYTGEKEGNQMWRGNFWPSREECLRRIEQSKGEIKGAIRGVCHNIYHTEDEETSDAVVVLTSSDSMHTMRFVDAEERAQLRYTNTMTDIGTAVGIGIYNDMVCIHTPENSIFLGNLYTGNFSMDIGGGETTGQNVNAPFHYKSVQMYCDRIAVLLSTGHVCFLI